jgi:hypothetical protein
VVVEVDGKHRGCHHGFAPGIRRPIAWSRVERPSTDAASIHRAKDLDVSDGVEAEPPGDPCLYQLDDSKPLHSSRSGCFRRGDQLDRPSREPDGSASSAPSAHSTNVFLSCLKSLSSPEIV